LETLDRRDENTEQMLARILAAIEGRLAEGSW